MSTHKPAFLRRWATWRGGVQIGVVALALGAGVRALLVPGSPSVEAYCPFGAIETAWVMLARGEYLRNLALSNGVALLLTLVVTVLLGRVFCGWACPVGAWQDLMAALTRRIVEPRAGVPLRFPPWLERPLRWGKVVVLGVILWASVSAVVPPLAPYCPFRTLFELRWNTLLSVGLILTFSVLAMTVERFWCRYLCPLGALLAPFNLISGWRPRVPVERCVSCGHCQATCPVGIDPVRDGTQHPECVRCMKCVETCPRLRRKSHREELVP
jgi:polyferredoxin